MKTRTLLTAFGLTLWATLTQQALAATASQGLRYNQFHTTALCSPTRTALLSGRNYHMNNMSSITEQR